jgi:hypothetical protein
VGQQWTCSLDIFPLGYYDHKFSGFSSFPQNQLSIMFFGAKYAHYHIRALFVKHWPIARDLKVVSQIVTCYQVTFVFFMISYVPIIPHIINSIFNALATKNKKEKTMYIKSRRGTIHQKNKAKRKHK